MAAELDLTNRLSQAIRDYEASWKPVDSELYDLCHRRSHDDFQDVHTKVAIVGRVYQAGIIRAWRGEGKAENEIAKVLTEQADPIKSGLQRLKGQPFDRQAAREIVQLHGRVTTAISRRSGNVFLTSFVSKYLHFHSDIVPIYDSIAQAAIGKLIDRRLVRPIRKALSAPEYSSVYLNFVAAFVVLHERAYTETTVKPTVKQLDHLLWWTSG
jgi:hypothetical protein